MRTTLLLVLAVAAGFAVGALIISKREAMRHAVAMAEQQAAWDAEKAALEEALQEARTRRPPPLAPVIVESAPTAGPVRLTPVEILAKLQTFKGNNPRNLRESIYWLAELAKCGPSALPAIREFLARNEDLDLAANNGRVPLDFVLPPSLRFGLFDVLRQIGGPDAEQILADSLARTGRGVEVAYLANALKEMAGDKYREQALSVARDLLASSTPLNSTSPLDRGHRDHLYSVLAMYNDTSFAGTAQAQLLQADGQIDRSALKYLQQVLGPQSVPIAAQAYSDPRVTDSAKKEPLARLALAFAGADQQANEFYNRAINDPVMTPSHRKNLIEDLNEDGLNFRNLTVQDLPLIKNRIMLIDQMAPSAMDKVNAAAFQEARKDLVNMVTRLERPPQ